MRSEVSEVVEEFRDFNADIRTLLATTPPELCFKWGLFHREPLETWSRGPVTLLGDAAHPMTPFLGQGAVMAIEDGMILARALTDATDVGEALAIYEHVRVERCNFVMLESLKRAKIFHKPDTRAQVADLRQNEEAMGLFGYNPVTVPLDQRWVPGAA